MRRLIYTFIIVLVAAGIPATAYWLLIASHLRSAKKMDALDYALHGSSHHDIVFIGASRVIRHVNPEIIDSITGLDSYVLGIDGMGIVESNMLMNVYLKHHPPPRCIFINVDNNILFTDGPLFNITDYFPYLKDSLVYACLSPYKVEYRNKFLQTELIFLRLMGTTDYERGMALEEKEMNRWYPQQLIKEYKGFQPVDHLWQRNMTMSLGERVHLIARENGFKILKNMVLTCREYNVIPAFLFTTQHQRADTIFVNQKQIMDRITTIADSLSVPFFNYDTLYIRKDKKYFIQYSLSNKNTGFFNYNHLNSTGANILSAALAQDIKQWIEKNPQNK